MSYDYDIHYHHELVLKKDAYVTKGLSGLVNLGNKCFMNSVLQCLSHTLKLTDYFLSSKYKSDDPEQMNKRKREYYVILSYLNLIINMWESNGVIKPKSFLNALGNFEKKYTVRAQQDSHECLLYILDLLHKGLSYEIVVDIIGDVQNDADKLMKKSIECWTECFKKNYSSIVDFFYGQFFDEIQCKKCNFVDTVFSPYNTLAVDICGGDNLESCLEEYFNPIEIDTWKCEQSKCEGNGCFKRTSIWTLPNYLVIQLKRFNKQNTKITNLVKFPLDDLDLTSYVSKDKEDPNNYIYTLYAVNYHSGGTGSGHYWAACRGINDKWFMFNDADVSRCKSSDIVSKDAYILFYFRKFIN